MKIDQLKNSPAFIEKVEAEFKQLHEGRNYIAEELHAKDAEIERLRAELQWAMSDEIKWCRHHYPAETCPYCAIIEECARVVESHRGFGITVQGVAAAIRALKDKP